MVEQFNRTLGECIAKLVHSENKEWDQYVDATLFAYRTKKHNTTGYTPFYLMYGRKATLPIDLKIPGLNEESHNPLMERLYKLIDQLENDRQHVIGTIEKEQARQKRRYDRQGISEKLSIGDKVLVERTWLKNNFSSKLEDKWTGPYYVHNVLENNVYKLKILEGRLVKNVVHRNRLKMYREILLEPMVVIE